MNATSPKIYNVALESDVPVFLVGLITGLYLFWKHSDVLAAFLFIVAGLILSAFVYVRKRQS